MRLSIHLMECGQLTPGTAVQRHSGVRALVQCMCDRWAMSLPTRVQCKCDEVVQGAPTHTNSAGAAAGLKQGTRGTKSGSWTQSDSRSHMER